MARRLVMSPMTSRDYNVILVSHNIQGRRIRKLGPTIHVHVLYCIVLYKDF